MKNELIKLKIEDIEHNGLGVAKYDNKVYFVKDGLIGDEVEAIITKETKNINYAKVVNYIKKSEFRVDSDCKVSKACGGCQLLELDYNKQLELKINFVKNNLIRIGKFDESLINDCYDGIISMDEPFHYRNKVQVPFSRRDENIISGFYASRTHYIVENDSCIASFKYADDIINITKNLFVKHNITVYSEKTNHGKFRELLLRRANNTNELSVCFIMNDKNYKNNLETYKKFAKDLVNDVKKYKNINDLEVSSVMLNINTDVTNTLLGDINVNLYGNDYIEDKLFDTKFRITNKSFYQVNMKLTEKLYDTAIKYADIKNTDKVLDLYCGIGTISLLMSKYANLVIGVEIVDDAIKCARENAEINNINNAEFICSDVGKLFDDNVLKSNAEQSLINKISDCNIVCVDPPRKGLDENTKMFIKKLKPEKIVYVSCDSATLARDLNELKDAGYKLVKYKLVDMFAHTMHVETVAVMEND